MDGEWSGRREGKSGQRFSVNKVTERIVCVNGEGWGVSSIGYKDIHDRAEVRKVGWRRIMEGLECLPCPRKYIRYFIDTQAFRRHQVFLSRRET